MEENQQPIQAVEPTQSTESQAEPTIAHYIPPENSPVSETSSRIQVYEKGVVLVLVVGILVAGVALYMRKASPVISAPHMVLATTTEPMSNTMTTSSETVDPFEGFTLPSGVATSSLHLLATSTIFIAKDNKNVYVGRYDNNTDNEVLIPYNDADAPTFIVLSDYFAKDNRNAYFLREDDVEGSTPVIIPRADPASFHIINSNFAADKSNLYVLYVVPCYEQCFTQYLQVSGVDLPSLKLFTYISTDNFGLGEPSVTNLDYFIFADKTGLYYFNTNRTGSFDKVKITDQYKKVTNIDIPSLTEITQMPLGGKGDRISFLKDKNNVYIYSTGSVDNENKYIDEFGKFSVIKGADPSTFALMQPTFVWDSQEGGNYFKDKNTVYYNDQSLTNADMVTFVNLGFGYAKDKSHVWYNGGIIPYADATSFVLEKNKDRVYIAHDKNNNYDQDQGTPIAGK